MLVKPVVAPSANKPSVLRLVTPEAVQLEFCTYLFYLSNLIYFFSGGTSIYMFLLLQRDSLGLYASRWLTDSAVSTTLYISDEQNTASGPHAALLQSDQKVSVHLTITVHAM